MELHWTLPHPYGKKVYAYAKLALELQHEIQRLVIAHAPNLRPTFPFFAGRFHTEGDISGGIIVVPLTININPTEEPSRIGQLAEPDVVTVQNVVDLTAFLSFTDLFERLGSD